jgi:hypothetical protein
LRSVLRHHPDVFLIRENGRAKVQMTLISTAELQRLTRRINPLVVT